MMACIRPPPGCQSAAASSRFQPALAHCLCLPMAQTPHTLTIKRNQMLKSTWHASAIVNVNPRAGCIAPAGIFARLPHVQSPLAPPAGYYSSSSPALPSGSAPSLCRCRSASCSRLPPGICTSSGAVKGADVWVVWRLTVARTRCRRLQITSAPAGAALHLLCQLPLPPSQPATPSHLSHPTCPHPPGPHSAAPAPPAPAARRRCGA